MIICQQAVSGKVSHHRQVVLAQSVTCMLSVVRVVKYLVGI